MIGYWMLYAIAAALPILLAAHVGSAALRRHRRPERGVWLAALGLALALPIVALLDPFGGTPNVAGPVPEGVIGLPEIFAVPEAPAGLGLNEVLLAAWLLVSTALVLRWAVAAFRLERLRPSWRREQVDGVSVWLTENLGPAVAGFLRPRILVPAWLASLPPSRRSLVLLHEQEHLRAGDPLIMAAARVAGILTPWNPVMWLMSSRLLDAVELDCDRRVLDRRPEVDVYGATLLDVATRGSGPLVAAAAFAEPSGPLRKRIVAMTTPAGTVSVVGVLTAGVLGVVLLLGACEVPIPVRLSIDVTVEHAGDAEDPAEQDAAAENVSPATGDRVAPEPATVAEPTVEPTKPPPPPSPEEAIRRIREERPVVPPTPPVERTTPPGPITDSEEELAAAPTFTPFTVAPSITNRDEVVAAMNEEYPPLLREAGIGGTVRVYFLIGADGLIKGTRVDKSSGHPAIDQAALRVASVYRFNPALNRDTPVPVWVSFPITFQVR